MIRLLGDFDSAEEARQEAFTAAMEQWAATGVPANPCAWLIKTGRNKAVDRIRRDVVFRTKVLDREMASAEADVAAVPEEADDTAFGDDRLRLIFTCCHPALGSEAQIALTLREVCRTHHPGGGPLLFGERGIHGAAPGAREEENPRCKDSV